MCFNVTEFQLTQVWKSKLFMGSMGLKKNSTYTMFFKSGLLSIHANGALDLFYKQKHSYFRNNCNQLSGQGNSLGFHKMASLFAILFFGIMISILILVYECFKTPKKILNTNTLSEEKLELLNKKVDVMVEKFLLDIQDLKSICQVPDSQFYTISGIKSRFR